MPVLFSAMTPVKYIEFDFEKYLDSSKMTFGHLSFFDEWKRFWLNTFLKLDEDVKDYIQRFPGSNPIMQRIKNYPSLSDYEMFQFEHKTDSGSFYYHFNVEKMKYIIRNKNISIEEIDLNHLYIDSTTPLLQNKLKDERLPFFIRMFGFNKPFICVDGNKRITARIQHGENTFKGYVFYPEDIQELFFGPIDYYFYVFHFEMELMYRQIKDFQGQEERVLQVTQLHLQKN